MILRMNTWTNNIARERRKSQGKKLLVLLITLSVLVLLFFISLGIGSSGVGFLSSWKALFGSGEVGTIRIVRGIRLPRTLGAIVVGAGLALSGLLMQACLRNGLASPSTLGVSNAASFGANIAIFIAFGTSHSSRNDFLYVSQSPWVTSAFALVFSILCLFLVMAFSAFAHFKPTSVLLIGVSFSSLFQALTTLLQYFADDVQLSSVTNWTFGDLERLDFAQNGIIGGIALACLIIAFFFSYPLNAMQGGEDLAKSLGVKTSVVRFILLFLSSLLTAVCVCFCGIIGFIGIMAPHILKRFVGNDMRLLLPASFLGGAGLLLICDILTRLIGRGTSLPVGAITALIGAPFFLFLLFSKKEKNL